MSETDDDPFDTYAVVVNEEEQYSIWPVEKGTPPGWRAEGTQGSKKECLEHINQAWVDMRPLSLRKKMDEWARNPPPPEPIESAPAAPPLVDRLCDGDHRVIVNCRPERTPQALKERLELGHVHLKFNDTRGGTELGVRLEPGASDWSDADFDHGTGTVRLAGTLTLDFCRVRCHAVIDVATLEGTGHLEKVADVAAV
jgi:uncharacterized protein YbdZ (MbtH family)